MCHMIYGSLPFTSCLSSDGGPVSLVFVREVFRGFDGRTSTIVTVVKSGVVVVLLTRERIWTLVRRGLGESPIVSTVVFSCDGPPDS